MAQNQAWQPAHQKTIRQRSSADEADDHAKWLCQPYNPFGMITMVYGYLYNLSSNQLGDGSGICQMASPVWMKRRRKIQPEKQEASYAKDIFWQFG